MPMSGGTISAFLLELTLRGFPELSDKFNLKTAQRVRISYRITLWLESSGNYFWTRLKIDGKVYGQFNFVTSITLERTHYVADEVWLEKRTHEIKVEYSTLKSITNIPPNGISYNFCLLKTEYLDF